MHHALHQWLKSENGGMVLVAFMIFMALFGLYRTIRYADEQIKAGRVLLAVWMALYYVTFLVGIGYIFYEYRQFLHQ